MKEWDSIRCKLLSGMREGKVYTVRWIASMRMTGADACLCVMWSYKFLKIVTKVNIYLGWENK